MRVNKITDLVGNTPVVGLQKMVKPGSAKLWGKLEYYNAAGSVKDRIALSMIEEAEKAGELKVGDTIIEPTSGNTGIGLAWIGAQKGYKVILVMPDIMCPDKMTMARAYGAEIITFLAPPSKWPAAFSALVKKPVDSMTISIPRESHFIDEGSRS